MKIKDGFVLREAAGSYVVIALGGELNFNGMITLNETGALIWNSIAYGKEKEEIAKSITEKYDVDYEIALSDVESFIEKMNGAGVIE